MKFIQKLKRFGDDERGVSPVVGFVLIFALIVIVFTLYQSSVVPAQNEEIEFKHSQTVEGQMSRLNDAIQQAGASGVPQSVTIDTGVQYPDRALAINPGTPAGTLETVDAPNVTLSGLSDGSGYWSDDETFETRLVSYQPSYNLLQQEAIYTLENGMFVKNFEGSNTLLESNGSVLSEDGERINLVLVGDGYQKSQMTTSATVRTVSSSTDYLSLMATESDSSITIPTTMPESDPDRRTWDNIVSDNDQIAGVSYDTRPNIPNAVTLGLKKGQRYSIRLSKVTFGNLGSPTLKYLESEDGRTNRTAAVGTPETFTVSAHDEFGNPFAGAKIDANTNGSGTFARSNGTGVNNIAANEDGRATFTYTPGAADAGNTTSVNFALDDGSGDTDLDNVSYNLTIPDKPDANRNGTTSGFAPGDLSNGYSVGVIVKSASADEIVFENIGSKDVDATAVRISGDFRRQGNSGGSPPENVFFSGETVELNGNLTTLDKYPIASGDSRSVTFDTNTQKSVKGGFLIMTVQYEYTQDGETETTAATYAVTIGQG